MWFQVSGTHNVYLTGNYVELASGNSGLFDPEDDDEEDYDLEPDEDELDYDEEDEDDELDDLQDPRITELNEEDEEEPPKLVEATKPKKGKKDSKKRPAEADADEEPQTLDELISKEADGAPKLSKKQLKKMKKNDGSAAAVENKSAEKSAEKPEAQSSAKSEKKVSFAKELEQGPTPSKGKADSNQPAEKEQASKPALGVKVVQGVTVDDKKIGSGPAAKNGDRVGMRYIGKLKDGKQFDANKKGKPFTFRLGAGEVIRGWEIGIQGMSVGGERRITIPAHLAYGSKGMPGIPANSTLVFDVKLISLNKAK